MKIPDSIKNPVDKESNPIDELNILDIANQIVINPEWKILLLKWDSKWSWCNEYCLPHKAFWYSGEENTRSNEYRKSGETDKILTLWKNQAIKALLARTGISILPRESEYLHSRLFSVNWNESEGIFHDNSDINKIREMTYFSFLSINVDEKNLHLNFRDEFSSKKGHQVEEAKWVSVDEYKWLVGKWKIQCSSCLTDDTIDQLSERIKKKNEPKIEVDLSDILGKPFSVKKQKPSEYDASHSKDIIDRASIEQGVSFLLTENLENYSAKDLLKALHYYMWNHFEDYQSRADSYRNIAQFIVNHLDKIEWKKWIPKYLRDEIMQIKGLLGSKYVPSSELQKVILNILWLRNIEEYRKQEWLNKEQKPDINYRLELKDFFQTTASQNIIEEKGYLEDVEENKKIFDEIIEGIFDKKEEEKTQTRGVQYSVTISNNIYIFQVDEWPIKENEAILKKLKHKSSIQTTPTDVIRSSITPLTQNIPDDHMDTIIEFFTQTIEDNYLWWTVLDMEVSWSGSKNWSKREGAKLIFSLKKENTQKTRAEIQILPSIQEHRNKQTGLKNHDYYDFLKDVLNNRSFEKWITMKDIDKLIVDLFNDKTYTPEKSREEDAYQIKNDILKNTYFYKWQYYPYLFTLQNKDKNINNKKQKEMYEAMLTSLKIIIVKSKVRELIEDEISKINKTEHQDIITELKLKTKITLQELRISNNKNSVWYKKFFKIIDEIKNTNTEIVLDKDYIYKTLSDYLLIKNNNIEEYITKEIDISDFEYKKEIMNGLFHNIIPTFLTQT